LALLHEIAGKLVGVPVFTILPDDDVYRRLRFFEYGAADCMDWPGDLERLAALIDVLSVRRRVELPGSAARNSRPEETIPVGKTTPNSKRAQTVVAGFVFASRAMRQLYQQIEAAADSDIHVLLTGETGTGKTHVSRAIHELSPRRKNPFVVVECGGLSPTLLESELFGHVRGSFTGADRDRVGKFAVVEDGTIFLDEVDCVPLDAQAKLLRVLEDGLYEPVGSNRVSKLRARVIAATNRPLDQLMAEGKFRSDLFYRLNVMEFRLPPLRECREAIGPLAENFLNHYAKQARRPVCEISFAALEAMMAYPWPGNIRELRNCIQRAVTLCRGESLDLADLIEPIRDAAGEVGRHVSYGTTTPARNELHSARQEGELQRLMQALTKHDNNRTQAAKELGISRVALYKKLYKFGLAEAPV
jgi:DNA-binding NtrC family response regulator